MIPDDVHSEILRRMHAAEQEHGVRILLAVESGSRAWGFASPNSDYDARFIYAHPAQWYLSVGLEEQRDVIEYPIVDDIDLNGWDVRKALRLFHVLRPLLAVRWLERYQTPAPIEFEKLLHLIEDEPGLRRDIDELLEKKRQTLELGLSSPVPGINAFIERELVRLENIVPVVHRRGDVLGSLNDVFHQVLGEV